MSDQSHEITNESNPIHAPFLEHVHIRNLNADYDGGSISGYTPISIWGSFQIAELRFSIFSNGILALETTEITQIPAREFHNYYIRALEFEDWFLAACDDLQALVNCGDKRNCLSILYGRNDTITNMQFFLDKLHNESELLPKVRKFVEELAAYNALEPSRPGYIYLLRAITPHNHYKIGLSRNPAARIASLGVRLPFPIKPIHQFPTNHRFKAEKALHERYADKRVNGEWFELSDHDVQDICAIERMDIDGVQL